MKKRQILSYAGEKHITGREQGAGLAPFFVRYTVLTDPVTAFSWHQTLPEK